MRWQFVFRRKALSRSERGTPFRFHVHNPRSSVPSPGGSVAGLTRASVQHAPSFAALLKRLRHSDGATTPRYRDVRTTMVYLHVRTWARAEKSFDRRDHPALVIGHEPCSDAHR